MKELFGRIAVVTGGGSGMGRELVHLLMAEDCHIAMCDVSRHSMAKTQQQYETTGLPQNLHITTHLTDISNETDLLHFHNDTRDQHATNRIHLLFNNTKINNDDNMVTNNRDK